MALIWIGLALVALVAAFRLVFYTWLPRWGATDAELTAKLPGDEGVPGAPLVHTQAITVAAPAEAVWPWLVQMGDGRGGLYSYDWLENLVGCNMHSVSHIVPELQNLKLGDMIRISPQGGPSVEAMEANRYLLLSAHMEDAKMQMHQTWVFSLQPLEGGQTRLITRQRINYGPSNFLGWLMWDLFGERGGLVMSRKMLLGIRQRAETVVTHL
ncbi:MAG TPA: SRPBCC family protein [Symbiobacteriaceae bacterium]|nr:SRPBCC family protein [Symbiobacteriaceae bacterium]